MPSVPAIPRPSPTAPCHARLAMTLQVVRTPIPHGGPLSLPPSPQTRGTGRSSRSSGECPAWLAVSNRQRLLCVGTARYCPCHGHDGTLGGRMMGRCALDTQAKSRTCSGRLCLSVFGADSGSGYSPALRSRAVQTGAKAPAAGTHLQPETNTGRPGPMRRNTVPCGRRRKDA
jgi:hypothetical protein